MDGFYDQDGALLVRETALGRLLTPSEWSIQELTGPNLTATLIRAGVPQQSHYLTSVVFSASGPASGATAQLHDGLNPIWQAYLTGSLLVLTLAHPLRMAPGNDLLLTLGSPGAGVYGGISATGFTR